MILIRECGEPLVDLRKACPGVVLDLGRERMEKEKTAYLRKSVAEMINRARWELPKGLTFVIRDAWRPQEVQKDIYDAFIDRFRANDPKKPVEEIREQVKEFVAPFQGPHASGHMTGGAVDLRLWKNGKRIPMRSEDLTYEENAQSVQPKLPAYLQKNRELMFRVLEKVGLSNYPKEFWHWSYGDYWWARRNGKKEAIYGVVDHT
jgi:D-alanyl-D-alanine dipeptidase